MNVFSLSADSRRWWWLPATAGALSAAAVTVILIIPATGRVAPAEPPVEPNGNTTGLVTVDRPCYMARPEWNTPRGWEHPVCSTRIDAPDRTDEAARSGRRMPPYLP